MRKSYDDKQDLLKKADTMAQAELPSFEIDKLPTTTESAGNYCELSE